MDRRAVTVVVEVGPATVRGPNPVDAELSAAAVEFVDDELALVGARPHDVSDLWRQVLHAAAGPDLPAVVLVVPAWWPQTRMRRVAAAARTTAAVVEVRRRAELLTEQIGTADAAVVEIAPECLAVCDDGGIDLITRSDDVESMCDAVAVALGRTATVLIDAPAEVPGAAVLAAALADRLRRGHIAVSVAPPDWWARQPQPPAEIPTVPPAERPRLSGRSWAVAAGAVLTTLGLLAGLPLSRSADEPAGAVPTTLLVEGRIGVLVPALWPPQRVTSGPGSARLQLVSPDHPRTALHLTQSPVPPHHTQQQMADMLAAALRDQPDGVFQEFNPADHRAGRAAVTYREVRAAHHIDWIVLLDRDVRIAVGCQHPPGRGELSATVCEQAIRSAHAVL